MPSYQRTHTELTLTLFCVSEKIAHAWRTTPTTWYPLPIFVGALLLVAIDFRRRFVWGAPPTPKVDVEQGDVNAKEKKDDDMNEVVRLKGPWQVSALLLLIIIHK